MILLAGNICELSLTCISLNHYFKMVNFKEDDYFQFFQYFIKDELNKGNSLIKESEKISKLIKKLDYISIGICCFSLFIFFYFIPCTSALDCNYCIDSDYFF